MALKSVGVFPVTEAGTPGAVFGYGPPAVVPHTKDTFVFALKAVALPFMVANVDPTNEASREVTAGATAGVMKDSTDPLVVPTEFVPRALK